MYGSTEAQGLFQEEKKQLVHSLAVKCQELRRSCPSQIFEAVIGRAVKWRREFADQHYDPPGMQRSRDEGVTECSSELSCFGKLRAGRDEDEFSNTVISRSHVGVVQPVCNLIEEARFSEGAVLRDGEWFFRSDMIRPNDCGAVRRATERIWLAQFQEEKPLTWSNFDMIPTRLMGHVGQWKQLCNGPIESFGPDLTIYMGDLVRKVSGRVKVWTSYSIICRSAKEGLYDLLLIHTHHSLVPVITHELAERFGALVTWDGLLLAPFEEELIAFIHRWSHAMIYERGSASIMEVIVGATLESHRLQLVPNVDHPMRLDLLAFAYPLPSRLLHQFKANYRIERFAD